MKEEHIINPPRQANSQTTALGLTTVAPPTFEMFADGQSVRNVPVPTTPTQSPSEKTSLHWFVIRATHGRAKHVYEDLVGLNSPNLEPYFPAVRNDAITLDDGIPKKLTKATPITRSLVFVRSTRDEYIHLVRAEYPYPTIKGLTPYYDHFSKREDGLNDYLIIPDRQFNNFRILVESGDTHILVDQTQMPAYLNGKKVEVTSGPFKGITGVLLRWKGLRRVFIKVGHIGTYATGFIRSCDFRILDSSSDN